MKLFLSIGLFLLVLTNISGQTSPDTIEYNKKSQYFYHGEKLTSEELSTLLKPNSKAYKEYSIAKGCEFFGYITGFAGGFTIGYALKNISSRRRRISRTRAKLCPSNGWNSNYDGFSRIFFCS